MPAVVPSGGESEGPGSQGSERADPEHSGGQGKPGKQGWFFVWHPFSPAPSFLEVGVQGSGAFPVLPVGLGRGCGDSELALFPKDCLGTPGRPPNPAQLARTSQAVGTW